MDHVAILKLVILMMRNWKKTLNQQQMYILIDVMDAPVVIQWYIYVKELTLLSGKPTDHCLMYFWKKIKSRKNYN